MCLTVLFLKNNSKIDKHCKLAESDVNGPQANYLDQGTWAISITEETQMEVICSDHTHVKTIKPPMTLINLQPACRAFSPKIKLPPYFKQYSQGFHVTLQAANIHVPTLSPNDYRIWKTFNLSNIKPLEGEKLKKLDSAFAILMEQLRSHISSFRHIDEDKDTTWIYYVGGGAGSGLLLLITIECIVYWCCKNNQDNIARKPPPMMYIALQNHNMSIPQVGAIGADHNSASGQVTVQSLEPVGDRRMDRDYQMQNAFASALLDQLED